MATQHGRFSTKGYLLGLLVIVLIGGGVILYVQHHNKKNPNLAASKNNHVTVKATPSTPTQHQQSTDNSTGQGGIVDQKGRVGGSLPPPSQWVSSTSGNIILQQPSANTIVRSGDTLSGTAKVSTVHFILKDSSVGLIAQGSLSVVNGKFSGTLEFTPHSKKGSLEVYYPNPQNGAEEDIIDVNVSYNP